MAALDDLLTAAKNIASAINGAAQTYANVQGLKTVTNITTPTQVSSKAGRLCTVSIVVAGSSNGVIYDNSVQSTQNPIYAAPDTLGVVGVNLPVSSGIYVVPGTGQTLAVSYS